MLGSASQSVMSENNPNSAGVVRAMARSDHCRCVSNAKMCAAFLKRRFDGPPAESWRISTGAALRSVQRKAWEIAHLGRIAYEHPSGLARQQSGMIPDRRSSRDIQMHRSSPYQYGIDSLVQCVVFFFEHLGV